MSFFKKMTDKFDDLIGDKDKKKEEKHDEGLSQTPLTKKKSLTLTPDPGTKNEQYQAGPQYGNYGGAPPPQQPQFSSGPPQLPPGWISQWDPNSQRYYYLEQASGRTQWEMPQHYQSGGPPPFQGQSGAPQMGGMGGYQAPGYAGQAPGYAGQPGQYQTNEYKDASGTVHKEFKDADKKKDKGHGGMLAAGAGGLAVGAIGGAVVANAMGESLSLALSFIAQQIATLQFSVLL